MDRMTTTAIFLSVLKAALCFNVDPVAWKTLTNPAAGFGYQVVQRQFDLLVSAPLAQYSPERRGQIFKCTSAEICREISFSLPNYAMNMSLGLTMASDPSTPNTVACGSTIPKDCKSITMYSGMCMQIDGSDRVIGPVPSSVRECRSADIAFLLDGSGSVSRPEFQTMKTFVKNLIRSLLPLDTKFAVAQFSNSPIVHYYFDNFPAGSGSWEAAVDNIVQLRRATFTAEAIRFVVENVFTPSRGSRSNVKKVLIVVTDGESNDRDKLDSAAQLAEDEKIVRFAIGVGNAFNNVNAKKELETIASEPKDSQVFRVENFAALEKIRESLQAKIFSIEGSQTSGESLKMEMAQEGFSAVYVPGGIQMGVVGANVWKGGYLQYPMRPNAEMTGSYESSIEPDSYAGYSIAVANTRQGMLTVVGAPRYKHRGVVMVVSQHQPRKMIDPYPWQSQSGEYFGAVVCAMNVDRDRYADIILISAPMFMDSDREGRVYACSITGLDVECHLDYSPLILKGDASDKARFGASLAVLPDLNMDGLGDLAVGAPLENDGQGSIYIFHGEGERISSTYSQKIAASEVQSGLKFFGISISQKSFDLSMDNLPEVAVGSKGAVVLLRSKPIVMVEATVSFSPSEIPSSSDCSTPLEIQAVISFTMTRHSPVNQVQAKVTYNLTLDATRKVPNNRAYMATKQQREIPGGVNLDLSRQPKSHLVIFNVDACPDDALNALSNELRFSFEGLPSSDNLRPSLALQAQTSTFYSLGFKINCGMDNKCVDNLKLDFNFSSSSEVKVGIDELLNVTVSLENRDEDSYNSQVVFTYPAGLSYRKFTSLQGRIECNSLDSEDGIARGRTDCSVDKPIFKGGNKALFIVSYGIKTNSQLDKSIFITANATSGNPEHSASSQLYKTKEIDVKYSIFATIESYSNFSFGKNDLQKPVQQLVTVTNDNRALNFTVVIMVPMKLGDKDIWVDSSSFQVPDCQRDGEDIKPKVTDFVAEIQKNKLVDCSVAWCAAFRCSRFMGRLEQKVYKISANISSGWIEQIGLQSAKFLLTSTATLEFNRTQYIFFSSASNNNPPVRKIEAEVEVYPEPDFTKEIVGGSLGGLALLALITAALYKAGFFKSKYKAIMDEDAANAAAAGGEPTPAEL